MTITVCVPSETSHTIDFEANAYDSRREAADTHMQGSFGRIFGCVALRGAAIAFSGGFRFFNRTFSVARFKSADRLSACSFILVPPI
jgi:hypothetical protein